MKNEENKEILNTKVNKEENTHENKKKVLLHAKTYAKQHSHQQAAIINMLVDTGASTNVMSLERVIKNGWTVNNEEKRTLNGFNGAHSTTEGTVELNVTLADRTRKIKFDVVKGIKKDILGKIALANFDAQINCKEDCIILGGSQIVPCFVIHKSN